MGCQPASSSARIARQVSLPKVDGADTIAAFAALAEDMSEFLKTSELTQTEWFRLSASVGGR